MATNILSLPLVIAAFTTGTNEDWIESLKFLVPDGSGNPDNYPQLDLRSITFQMEIRPSVDDHEVVLQAGTDIGGISIGDYPNYGWLIIDIPVTQISQRAASPNYVGDIVASDEFFTRRCVTLALNLVEGVTR